MSRPVRRFWLFVGCVLGLWMAAQPASAAKKGKADPGPCAGVRYKLHKLGGSTRFERQVPVDTQEKLQAMFADEKTRKAVAAVLAKEKMGDLAEPVFAAVAAGKAVKAQFDPGSNFGWMAYRSAKTHKPKEVANPCWAGKAPFDAWAVVVQKDDASYAFIVPVACGNLAVTEYKPPVCDLQAGTRGFVLSLDASHSTPGTRPVTAYGWTVDKSSETGTNPLFTRTFPCPDGTTVHFDTAVQLTDDWGGRSKVCSKPAGAVCPKPPVCKITAKENCEKKTLDVDTTGSSVDTAGGVTLKSLSVTSDPALSIPPAPEPGTVQIPRPAPEKTAAYTFTATVVDSNEGKATCSASLEVEPPPVCKVAASRAPGADVVKVDLNGTTGTGIKAAAKGPDGKDVAVDGSGPDRTFHPGPAGDYTVNVSTGTRACPDSEHCSTQIEVPCCDRTPWTLRVYGGALRAGEDTFFETLNGGTAQEERRQLKIGGTNALFGAGLEYRFRNPDRSRGPWGLSFDVMRSETGVDGMLDNVRVWAMDEDTVSVMPVLFGVNYHFLPNTSRGDVWIGPTLGWLSYGTAHLNMDSRAFNEKLDGDWGFGAVLGADYAFGKHRCWLFTGSLRYLKASSDVHGPISFKTDVDPLIATVGFGYRF